MKPEKKEIDFIRDSGGETVQGKALETVAYVCGKLGMSYHVLESRLFAIDEKDELLVVRWKVHPSDPEMDAFKAAWEWQNHDGEKVHHYAGEDCILRWDYEVGIYVDMG